MKGVREIVDNTEELGISFCTGYGGIEQGLELAGIKHRIVVHVEIEAYAIANLVAKMEQGYLVPAPVWTNLKTFPMEAFRGRVDFITAGYPCQPFSCAGQRKGTDDPRHLWPYLRRIYKTIRPRWMLFENVEGHVTLGLATVISDLEEDGYRTTWGLFTAAEVGAPHRRKRVFILAHSRSLYAKRTNKDGIYERRICELSRDDKIRNKNIGCGASDRELADTERSNESGQTGGQWTREIGRSCAWPSSPGEPQHEWEEPRAVESGVGCTVDGFNTRVDQLRILGNGVVPQQAAIAYLILRDRLRKD